MTRWENEPLTKYIQMKATNTEKSWKIALPLSYSLRSNNSTQLLPPTHKMLPTLGTRSFAAAAPALWNKLPAAIRNVASLNIFKKSIKTFPFNESLFTFSPFNIVFHFIWNFCKALSITSGKSAIKIFNWLLL